LLQPLLLSPLLSLEYQRIIKTHLIKEFNMTKNTNSQVVSLFAALVCTFITIGMSVAPAVAPLAAIVA
jgi:hypothetical protein